MKSCFFSLCLTIVLAVQVNSHSLQLKAVGDEKEDALKALNDLTSVISDKMTDCVPAFHDILRFIDTAKSNTITDTKTSILQMSTAMLSELSEWKKKAETAQCDITECTADEPALVELPAKANSDVQVNANGNANTAVAAVMQNQNVAMATVDQIDLRSNQIYACGNGEAAAKCLVKATTDINNDIKKLPGLIDQSLSAASKSYTLYITNLNKTNRAIIMDLGENMSSGLTEIVTCIDGKLKQ